MKDDDISDDELDPNREFYKSLMEDIQRVSGLETTDKNEAFLKLFSETAAEAGDLNSDIDILTGVSYQGSRSHRVDGWIPVDIENGDLTLCISDFSDNPELQNIDKTDSENLFKLCKRFFDRAMQKDFTEELEEKSDAFHVASEIYDKKKAIRRLKLVLLTNRISVMRKAFEVVEENGITLVKNIFDYNRYFALNSDINGMDEIEIDLVEEGFDPIPCLETSSESNDYKSYLAVVRGEFLADIYAKYGTKLLEQNVRVYLQNRTNVNKAMQETLKTNPEMFFAYNNGLTCTASDVEVEEKENGQTFISKLRNLQIVNGGQTTASILYARDKEKSELEKVSVQMKLSKIEPEKLSETVSKISRYSNFQNKVNAADFSATHPYHAWFENTSKRIPSPRKDGEKDASYWFYERARGTYNNMTLYKSRTESNRIKSKYPKSKMIKKDDVAKVYFLTNFILPIVIRGPATYVPKFAEIETKRFEKNQKAFNDEYYKNFIAYMILWYGIESLVTKSEWYKNEKGYRAETVHYTFSYFLHWLKEKGFVCDLRQIWFDHKVNEKTLCLISKIAQKVREFILDTPPEVINVKEYCKKDYCWTKLIEQLKISDEASDHGISISEHKQRIVHAEDEGEIDKELGHDIFLAKLISRKSEIIEIDELGDRHRLHNPETKLAIRKLLRMEINLTHKSRDKFIKLVKYIDNTFEKNFYRD